MNAGHAILKLINKDITLTMKNIGKKFQNLDLIKNLWVYIGKRKEKLVFWDILYYFLMHLFFLFVFLFGF